MSDGEFGFTNMDTLMAEIRRRRAEGHDIVQTDDAKHRILGFFDRTAEESLTIATRYCSTSEIQAHAEVEEPDALLVDLWSDVTPDLEEAVIEQVEADRAAAADTSLPTEAEMKARVAAIEAGIREAGANWGVRTFPASPFTFRWGTHDSRKHHEEIAVRTDVSGVTVLVGHREGVLLDGRHHAARLTWADGDGVLTEWVAEQVREALPKYEALPECRCFGYHPGRRTGIK